MRGALCISYSETVLHVGMISERSANGGSCPQSCRKDYSLTYSITGETLDTGFPDLRARSRRARHLRGAGGGGDSHDQGRGRKKKPEYVATVTRSYRVFLDQVAKGEHAQPARATGDLVQIFSRGFTGGMYGGRAEGC